MVENSIQHNWTIHKNHPPQAPLSQIRHIIAVASGKGGVGKSTVAANLAVSLSKLGLKIGILDADIYGPSLPKIFGLKEKPTFSETKQILPLERYGLKMMSMGFLLPEDTPIIWRGPVVQKALHQLLFDVDWGELDILVLDLPPGTGDVQLTLAQKGRLSGAIIISTPQDLALIDARKGLNMFLKTNIPVLGLIENMSYFSCPHCNYQSDIFGHGGARSEANKMEIDFLGEIPLDLEVRQSCDSGEPITLKNPHNQATKVFDSIARKLWDLLKSN